MMERKVEEELCVGIISQGEHRSHAFGKCPFERLAQGYGSWRSW